jgi:hypothetical protein
LGYTVRSCLKKNKGWVDNPVVESFSVLRVLGLSSRTKKSKEEGGGDGGRKKGREERTLIHPEWLSSKSLLVRQL